MAVCNASFNQNSEQVRASVGGYYGPGVHFLAPPAAQRRSTPILLSSPPHPSPAPHPRGFSVLSPHRIALPARMMSRRLPPLLVPRARGPLATFSSYTSTPRRMNTPTMMMAMFCRLLRWLAMVTVRPWHLPTLSQLVALGDEKKRQVFDGSWGLQLYTIESRY
jgi:hypothetical protein